ncbi:MAG TPA: ribosomal protein L7/L12 [Candidatus Angelobacter sp.]|nr:ribosomal protein L7/L12 [Candidatus Angelobacter sp.]
MADEQKYLQESTHRTVPQVAVDAAFNKRGISEAALRRVLNPTGDDLEREAQRQIEATTVRDERGDVVIPGRPVDQILTSKNVAASTRRLLASQNDRLREVNDAGWEPYMVINLLPFPLKLNSVIHSRYNLVVPPAPVQRKNKNIVSYGYLCIEHLCWDHEDNGTDMTGVDNYKAIPYLPKTMARGFVTEFCEIQGIGGVFMYAGTRVPEAMGPPIRHLLEEERQRRFMWCQARAQEADMLWSSEKTRMQVDNIHRDAWRILLEEGGVKLEDKPVWLTAARPSSMISAESCPVCTATRIGPMCGKCPYVFDPLKAYEESMIEWGHPSFKKMTPEQWQKARQIKADFERMLNEGTEPLAPQSNAPVPTPAATADGGGTATALVVKSDPQPPATDATTEFKITLKATGQQRGKVAKAISELQGISVNAAKDLMERLPQVIHVTRDEKDAERVMNLLNEAGATLDV